MRNLVACIAVLVFLQLPLRAQFGFGKVEEVLSLKKRDLIIIVEEPRERILKKLTKKGKTDKIDLYKSAVEEYNALMKEVVEKFWKFSEGKIHYMTLDEAKKITDKTKYAVLFCFSARPSGFNSGFVTAEGLMWTWDVREDSEDRDYIEYFTQFEIDLLENAQRGIPVYSTTLVDIFPTKTSLVTAVNGANFYLDYRARNEKMKMKDAREMIAANQSRLKEKTLLLRTDFLGTEFATEAAIKAVYPWKFQIVTKEEMDAFVMEGNPAYAYALIAPNVISTSSSNSVHFTHVVIDCGDGACLGFSMPKGPMIGLGAVVLNNGKRYHSEDTFKDFSTLQ